MSESGPVATPRALVAGHAEFAAGLVSAVELICGRGELLVPIRVTGLCGADIEELLKRRLVETGARVIFTDLQAGSCTMAARRVQREVAGVVLVAGANLPMLLDFAMTNEPDLAVAATSAAEKGRTSVNVFGGST
ncbi:MAG: phosphotransferase system enzyme component [Gemmatimonadetes bacterium]|jgi:PTS system N-acetylgalactosamine-specific IIA component|nr:phosphotransferase system enzyme component [Gemmatimonadota bacterium]